MFFIQLEGYRYDFCFQPLRAQVGYDQAGPNGMVGCIRSKIRWVVSQQVRIWQQYMLSQRLEDGLAHLLCTVKGYNILVLDRVHKLGYGKGGCGLATQPALSYSSSSQEIVHHELCEVFIMSMMHVHYFFTLLERVLCHFLTDKCQ